MLVKNSRSKSKRYVIWSGAILQFKNEKLEEVLTGTCDKILDDEGKTLHFSQFKNTGITQLKKHPEKNILYGFDYQAVGRFYALNLDTKKVKLIKTFENHDFKSLDMFNDLPMLSGAKLTIVSPNSGEILQSECRSDLIGKDRIYGVTFLPNQNKWFFINSSKRLIQEAKIEIGNTYTEAECAILQSTTIDEEDVAFLNRFGTTDNKYHVSEDQLLVLDSDGYNLIRYFLDG